MLVLTAPNFEIANSTLVLDILEGAGNKLGQLLLCFQNNEATTAQTLHGGKFQPLVEDSSGSIRAALGVCS